MGRITQQSIGLLTGGAEGAGDAQDPSRAIASERALNGDEALASLWTFLDLTPYGRQGAWEDSPEGWPQTPPHEWWRRHDEYDLDAVKLENAR